MIETLSLSIASPQPRAAERTVHTLLNLNVVVTKHELNIELPGLASSFEPCAYGIKAKVFIDKNVRNCQKTLINGDQFASINLSLTQAMKMHENAEDFGMWEVLKYENGHFVEHIDFQRPLQGYVHIANQILIPPSSKCQYEGGCLKLWDEVKRFQIYPDDVLWTRVIIPHGAPHQVEKVTGTRITYMRPIYVVKKQGKSYRNLNENYQGPTEIDALQYYKKETQDYEGPREA